MKSTLNFLILLTIIFMQTGCKDGQMGDDPVGELVVNISGHVTPPPGWGYPKVIATYPKFYRIYDTSIIGDINITGWSLYVEKYSIINIFLFNDVNNNEAFDYLTEPRLPHSDNSITAGLSDLYTGEIAVREITGNIETPSNWDAPLVFIMKGNDIFGYSRIENDAFTLYAGAGNDYSVCVYNDNGDNYFNYLNETKYDHTDNPIDTSGGDINLNDFKIRRVYGTITYTSGVENNPSLIQNLIVGLVYPDSSGNAVSESFTQINDDGTYAVYGIARDQYRLWIVDDKNLNSTYDYEDREPYAQVPERGGLAFKDDTFFSTLSTGENIDLTLGLLQGSIDNSSAAWNYPQASLFQGWDVTAFNETDNLYFQFFAVKDYSIGGAGTVTQNYYILLFDDDNTHDGIYVWDDENDEVKQYGPYAPDQTSLDNLSTL